MKAFVETICDPLNWWVAAWFICGMGLGVLAMAVFG